MCICAFKLFVCVCACVSYLCPVGLTDPMQAVEFATGLTARLHPGLHVAAGEVLQLVVNVEVPDASVETGHVERV